jgi:hypothetical protein
MERVHTAQIESPIGPLRLLSTVRGLAYVEHSCRGTCSQT